MRRALPNVKGESVVQRAMVAFISGAPAAVFPTVPSPHTCPALCDPGDRHSIPEDPQAEAF